MSGARPLCSEELGTTETPLQAAITSPGTTTGPGTTSSPVGRYPCSRSVSPGPRGYPSRGGSSPQAPRALRCCGCGAEAQTASLLHQCCDGSGVHKTPLLAGLQTTALTVKRPCVRPALHKTTSLQQQQHQNTFQQQQQQISDSQIDSLPHSLLKPRHLFGRVLASLLPHLSPLPSSVFQSQTSVNCAPGGDQSTPLNPSLSIAGDQPSGEPHVSPCHGRAGGFCCCCCQLNKRLGCSDPVRLSSGESFEVTFDVGSLSPYQHHKQSCPCSQGAPPHPSTEPASHCRSPSPALHPHAITNTTPQVCSQQPHPSCLAMGQAQGQATDMNTGVFDGETYPRGDHHPPRSDPYPRCDSRAGRGAARRAARPLRRGCNGTGTRAGGEMTKYFSPNRTMGCGRVSEAGVQSWPGGSSGYGTRDADEDNINEAHNHYSVSAGGGSPAGRLGGVRSPDPRGDHYQRGGAGAAATAGGAKVSPYSTQPSLLSQYIKIARLRVGMDKRLTIIDEKSPAVLKYRTPHFRALATLEVPPLQEGEAFQIGWIQVCTDMEFVNVYGSDGLTSWEFPEIVSGKYKMISDADGKQYPWYGSKDEVRTLRGPIEAYTTVTVHMNDNFFPQVTWYIPHNDYLRQPKLTHIYRKQHFYAFLALRDLTNQKFRILRTVAWSMELAIEVNPSMPLGRRAKLLGPFEQVQPRLLDDGSSHHLLETYAMNPPNANNAQVLVWRPRVGAPSAIVPPVQTTIDVNQYLMATADYTQRLSQLVTRIFGSTPSY